MARTSGVAGTSWPRGGSSAGGKGTNCAMRRTAATARKILAPGVFFMVSLMAMWNQNRAVSGNTQTSCVGSGPTPWGFIQPSSSEGGLRRSPFKRPLRFLFLRRRSFSRRGIRVEILGAGRQFSASRRFLRRTRAVALFRNWLRSSLAVTETPVGRWTKRTPLSVRFWCWPPFPPAWKVSTRHWERRSSSDSGMGKGTEGSFSSFMGKRWQDSSEFLWLWVCRLGYLPVEKGTLIVIPAFCGSSLG
jgi:hypothetical protein